MSFAEEILAAAAGKRCSSRGWIRIDCPMCEMVVGKPDRKQCLGVSARSGRYSCWRCGSSDKLPNFDPSDFDLTYDKGEIEEEGPRGVDPPDGFVQVGVEPAVSSQICAAPIDYLTRTPALGGRGLPLDLVRRAKIGACFHGRYQGRVIVPIFSDDGAWLWYVGRSWVKKADRPYMYPSGNRTGLIFNHRALFEETDEPIAVVEGVFDALTLWPNAVAVLGKHTEEQISALVEAKRPIAVVYDGDAHEYGDALALRLRFEGKKAGNVILPPRKDPDEVDRAWLLSRMRACIDEP